MKTHEMPVRFTLSYYDGEEEGRPPIPKGHCYSISFCQWVLDQIAVPYTAVCITQWNRDDNYEEPAAQMSAQEAFDYHLYEPSLI